MSTFNSLKLFVDEQLFNTLNASNKKKIRKKTEKLKIYNYRNKYLSICKYIPDMMFGDNLKFIAAGDLFKFSAPDIFSTFIGVYSGLVSSIYEELL